MSEKDFTDYQERQIQNLQKLLESKSLEKINILAQILSNTNREELDVLKQQHPDLITFVINHYSKYSKEV